MATRESPRLSMRPLASMPRLAVSSAWSKRTEISRRFCGRSMESSARRSSARFAGLARTKSWAPWPESVAPGSSSGCSAGITCSAVRWRRPMISKAFCATTGVESKSETANRITAPRFIFLPERAKLHSVYAPSIMRHKLLFTCAFICLLGSASTRASSETTKDYRMAAALQALFAVGVRYHYGGNSPDTGFDCSGLVAHVFDRAWGVALPRSAEEQRNVGRAVKRAELQPGDLVFYNTRNRPFSHVGIYLGDGNFLHAPRPGQRVRIESIDTPSWRARFNGARRLHPPGY